MANLGHKHISFELKNLIISNVTKGLNYTQVGKLLNIDRKTVSYWYQKYQTDGITGLKSGHFGKKSDAFSKLNKSRLIEKAKQNPFLTATDLKECLQLSWSKRYIRKILHKNGLKGRKAAKKEKLSEVHQYGRYIFAESMIQNDESFWRKVCFSDEKTFVVGTHGDIYVRRPDNQRYEQEYLAQKWLSGKFSVNVWGLISFHKTLILIRLPSSFNSRNYLNLLQDIALPTLLQEFGTDFIYQQDNSPIHTAKIIQEWINCIGFPELEKMNTITWPVKGSDMSPIENVWALMVKKLNNSSPKNAQELWENVFKTWCEISKDTKYYMDLYNSIPNRIKQVYANNGHWTKY
ncbi:hypothetical protein B4U79_17439 [Dinothrombium tinctorium]|uniref:Uncharacterized protein n=1 Tax=Dinothrombium tinctorium TaxID=1965070 RepID=A0A3S3PM82_9ACAR|nr:hypothetical protein B4U79_17439 [Dinothrombium tinctorium]